MRNVQVRAASFVGFGCETASSVAGAPLRYERRRASPKNKIAATDWVAAIAKGETKEGYFFCTIQSNSMVMSSPVVISPRPGILGFGGLTW